MTAHTLQSGQNHHFREKEFKRSFLVSLGVHLMVLAAAGSVTLFRMTGTTYAPSYTVDLVSLPPSPAQENGKTEAPAKPVASPKPAVVPEKKPVKNASPAKEAPRPPARALEEIRPAGGDEAARLERRRRIEELEEEARKLYESYTSDEVPPATERSTGEPAAAEEKPAGGSRAMTGQASSGGGQASDLRFRAYYDLIWAQIRSSWVLPEGVAAGDSLLTVVGIRISPLGDIQQYWIEKRSGNPYYDQSAIRAIRKSSPLPPLPRELGEGSLEVGVNFRYPE